LKEVLSKTRKIDSFFKSDFKSSTSAHENSETGDIAAVSTNSFTHILLTQEEEDTQQTEADESNSNRPTPVPMADTPMPDKSSERVKVGGIFTLSSFSAHQDFTQFTNESASASPNYKNDVGLWVTPISGDAVEFWIERGSENLQNAEKSLLEKYSFCQDRQDRPTDVRKCPISLFSRVMKNKELVLRKWLCFSPATGKVYCFVCKLMQSSQYTSKFANQGVCNWRKSELTQKFSRSSQFASVFH
jgi:hypothetical protein